MQVLPGDLNVTTYFMLRKTSNGIAATGLTITGIDLQYTRSGVAPTAKVDATALVATDSAHGDNLAIEIDATDQPGLYRVDWPDAAFATGVREVILTVKEATIFTESQRINLEGPLTAMNAEMDKAIVDVGLDHLVAASVTGTDIVNNSIIARMVSKSATADWDSFTHITDSLEAARDKLTDIETDTDVIDDGTSGLVKSTTGSCARTCCESITSTSSPSGSWNAWP